jgi:hypothetical protein
MWYWPFDKFNIKDNIVGSKSAWKGGVKMVRGPLGIPDLAAKPMKVRLGIHPKAHSLRYTIALKAFLGEIKNVTDNSYMLGDNSYMFGLIRFRCRLAGYCQSTFGYTTIFTLGLQVKQQKRERRCILIIKKCVACDPSNPTELESCPLNMWMWIIIYLDFVERKLVFTLHNYTLRVKNIPSKYSFTLLKSTPKLYFGEKWDKSNLWYPPFVFTKVALFPWIPSTGQIEAYKEWSTMGLYSSLFR